MPRGFSVVKFCSRTCLSPPSSEHTGPVLVWRSEPAPNRPAPCVVSNWESIRSKLGVRCYGQKLNARHPSPTPPAP